jgi:hypothetical protein
MGPAQRRFLHSRGLTMWHLGIDLHRNSLTLAAVSDGGELRPPVRIECLDTDGIVAAVAAVSPFRAVVEATSHYRWLVRRVVFGMWLHLPLPPPSAPLS